MLHLKQKQSYHSKNATVHTCIFLTLRSLSATSFIMSHPPFLFSSPDAFLPWPASVSKSLSNVQYSSHGKEEAGAGAGGGRKMERSKAQRSSWVMTAVHTCLWQQSSCLQETSRCLNVWFSNICGRPSEKARFLIVVSICCIILVFLSIYHTNKTKKCQTRSTAALKPLPPLKVIFAPRKNMLGPKIPERKFFLF